MRLKVSADKLELRQSYIPALFPYLVGPLMTNGVVSTFALGILSDGLTGIVVAERGR